MTIGERKQSILTVSAGYRIDPAARIAPTVRILGDVSIGKGAVIHDFVTLYPKVVIGNNVEIFEGSIIGRPPRGTKAGSRAVPPEMRPTRIGDGCVISSHAIVYTDVEIGGETLVGDGASILDGCRIGSHCIIGRSVTMYYNVTIGDHTKIMDSTNITGNMKIGSHVFISALVSTTNDNSMGALGYDDNKIVGPTIEDYASIGAGANILPGRVVGHGSVVGAGAVVTKDVPPQKLVMGIPAKVIRDV